VIDIGLVETAAQIIQCCALLCDRGVLVDWPAPPASRRRLDAEAEERRRLTALIADQRSAPPAAPQPTLGPASPAPGLVAVAAVGTMTADLLCRVGAALYGEHWHASLAHDLGVPRRTVQRWAAGDARPRPTLRRNLARLVAARQDMLGKLYRELASG
jgi:hypothetical protein